MTYQCGMFTPVAGVGSPFTAVHFFPKNGNQIVIGGHIRTIPPGVGVRSGGVVGTYNDATINKTPHQTLAPYTLYFVYVFWADGRMQMDFSQTGHKEDADYGNEVHASDPSRSLVGMVYTDGEGKFRGNATQQNTLSWFNQVRTVLSRQITGASTSSGAFVEISAAHRLEWLQWGINADFTEAQIRPMVNFSGYGSNSAAGSTIGIAIGFNGDGAAHGVRASQSVSAGNLQSLSSCAAAPQTEGHHYAQALLVASGGGVATLNDSTFSVNVLTS